MPVKARSLLILACLLALGPRVSLAQEGAPPGDASAASADDVGFADSPVESAAAPAAASADETGFGPPSAAPIAAVAAESEEPSAWTLGATLWVHAALRLRDTSEPYARNLRETFDARLEWRHELGAGWGLRALISGRSEVDFAVLANLSAYAAPDADLYAWQLLPRETYLALAGSVFELRVGEQIVNLGQGEMLSVLDVVNPRDLREPLIAEPGSLRMPVLMTRAVATIDSVRFEALVVHEPYFGLTPPPLGEWSPFRRLLLSSPGLGAALAGRTLTNLHLPERDVSDFEATQAHGRIGWSGHGIDLQLSVSNLLDPLGVPTLPPPAAFDTTEIGLPIVHPRYTAFGHSGALTLGEFLLRWEAVFEYSRAIAMRDTAGASVLGFSSLRLHGLRGMLGLTYAPSVSTSAALEVQQGYLFDNPSRQPALHTVPLFPVEATQVALRFSHRFLRDRAQVSLLGLLIGVQRLNAWAGRVDVSYAILDRLELMLGFVTYHPTDQLGFFYGFDHHERLFLDVRWDLG